MAGWKQIKGETPLDDLSGFKHFNQFPTLTREIINGLEAENIRKATVRYLTKKPSKTTAPFTYEWLLKLHREMFGDVWNWAGTLRQTQTNIGIAAFQIPEALQAMLLNLEYWKKLPALEAAAMLHHRAVQIHPFLNGNGRWSRMTANILLKQAGQKLTFWPTDIDNETSNREEYLTAMRAADGMDYKLLIGLHRRYTQ